MRRGFSYLVAALSLTALASCGDEPGASGAAQPDAPLAHPAKVTFVELGSVNCIPCRQMQPVMQSIERKYGGQVRVVFHDVWKDPAPGRKYGVRLIPTQVFLDERGAEISRHEGFLPEAVIDEFLQARGLTVVKRTEGAKSP